MRRLMRPAGLIVVCASVVACGGDDDDGGGTAAGGGSTNGGALSGGSTNGGALSGGSTTGGAGNGGAGNGGAPSGGGTNGGASTGGGGTGGFTPDATYDCAAPAGGRPGLQLQEYATGFDFPLLATAPAGDMERLFVVEQNSGLVKIVKSGTTLATPFLDVSADLESSPNEQGFLGLAFHPDFMTNGRVYVHYNIKTLKGFGDTRISEFTVSSANPDVADPDSERVILEVEQDANNHNGGSIEFGPDGYLYIGLGDGGGSNDGFDNGQDPSTLLGAILRIDVDETDGDGEYGVPSGNLADTMPLAAPEVWSYGWRNPYRFNFDPCSGDLIVGDVGQNQYEEISFEPFAGADGARPATRNYGWPLREAEECYLSATSCASDPANVLPVASYARNSADGGFSVTGGHVYRGAAVAGLRGTYLYADYVTGNFWAFATSDVVLGADDQRTFGELITDDINPGRAVRNVSSLGRDGSGELYVVTFGPNVSDTQGPGAGDGVVYRIVAD